MYAMMRVIFAALTLASVLGINPNPVHAAPGEEFTCDYSRPQINNFIDCGRCGSCPGGGTDLLARHNGDQNTTALLKLSEELGRARVAKATLRNKADKSVVEALERRITELESQGNGLCGGLKQDTHVSLCLQAIKEGTVEMQQNLLKLLTSAFDADIPHEILLIQGAGPLSPGLFLSSKTPTEEILPAFANARRDHRRPTAPEVDAQPWSYFAAGAGGCLALAGVGYGVSDGFNVNFDTRQYREGDEDKGIGLGCGVGAVGGILLAWIHNSNINDGDD